MVSHFDQCVFITFSILLSTLVALSNGKTTNTVPRVGFYKNTCPRAESIVRQTIERHYKSNPTVAPGLLRMHFHDCFVHGCDGSILINGTGSERSAGPNLLLRGFDAIDDAKQQLEKTCPGVVSCADIVALAARDSVVLTSKHNSISWSVPTGRRDGRISQATDTNNLPNFRDNVTVQIQKFQAKGLNIRDLVALVGAHTIGTSACQFFSYRLYNFTTAGGPDPTIDRKFLPTLRNLCPSGGNGSVRVELDNRSGTRFDDTFFAKLRAGRGVLESDQRLWGDSSTSNVLRQFLGVRGLHRLTFESEFEKSMVKMSMVGVKTGSQGEIRKVCYAIN
ncbi:Peroxidase N1 [Orobanche gracilis]